MNPRRLCAISRSYLLRRPPGIARLPKRLPTAIPHEVFDHDSRNLCKLPQGLWLTYRGSGATMAPEIGQDPTRTLHDWSTRSPKYEPKTSSISCKDFARWPRDSPNLSPKNTPGIHQCPLKGLPRFPQEFHQISRGNRRSMFTMLVQALRRILCDSPKDSRRQSPNIAPRS